MKVISICLFTLLTVSFTLSAAAPDEQRTMRLLYASGDDKTVLMIASSAANPFTALNDFADSSELVAMSIHMTSAITVDTVRKSYFEVFKSKHSPVLYDSVLAFFSSNLFNKIRACNENSENSTGRSELETYLGGSERLPLSPEREKLLLAVLMKTGLLKLSLKQTILYPLEAQMCTIAFLQNIPGMTRQDARDLAMDIYAQRMEDVQTFLLASISFIYRDISDAELSTYIAFYEGRAGCWYLTTLSDAAERVFAEYIRSLQ